MELGPPFMTLIYVTGQVTLIHNILLSAVGTRVLIFYGLQYLIRGFVAPSAS